MYAAIIVVTTDQALGSLYWTIGPCALAACVPAATTSSTSTNIAAIAEAACELMAKREAWLNPPGASEAELKKRTHTNLYTANASRRGRDQVAP